MYRLRTVDVWDTVLRRKCHPDAVKLETARKAVIRHRAKIRPEYRESWRLLCLRFEVEKDLARSSTMQPGQDDEYTLEDVLKEWIARAFIEPDESGIAMAQGLLLEELQHERFVSYADVGIRQELEKYPAEKTVFASDFYMSASNLFYLLRVNDMSDLFDGGYASCDHHVNKRSGRLFTVIARSHQLSPEHHIHIGDNPVTDLRMPRRHGIRAVLYRPRRDVHRAKQLRKALFDRNALFRALQDQCLATAESFQNRRIERAYRYGIKLSPLFAAFALFMLEAAQEDQIDRLFFSTREGELFIKTYELIRRACPRTATGVAEGALLEISRLSTFAASLREISINEMMRLWTAFTRQSIGVLMQSLGYDSPRVKDWCTRHRLNIDEPIEKPWLNQRVRLFLEDPEINAALEQHVSESRINLKEYLKSKNWPLTKGRVALVDIGWRGSVQDNLSILFPDVEINGYYLGLQKYLNVQTSNVRKAAFCVDLNRSADGSKLFRNLPLLEMLTNSPNGSVVGYGRGVDGRVVSHRRIDEEENRAHENVCQAVQHGILHGVKTWSEPLHIHAVSSVELQGLAIKTWESLVTKPPDLVMSQLRQLKHNEVFGMGRFSTPKLKSSRFSLKFSRKSH